MTFLDHGDIRKAGRAILIASTLLVLINECSSPFSSVSLFGFHVNIPQSEVLRFLAISVLALLVVFLIRFFQGITPFMDAILGETARVGRDDMLDSEASVKRDKIGSRLDCIKWVTEAFGPDSVQGIYVDDPENGNKIQEHTKRLQIINREFRRYRARRVGDIVDAVGIQVLLPGAAAVYALALSSSLSFVCSLEVPEVEESMYELGHDQSEPNDK